MRAYVAFSRTAGVSDGSCLVIAQSARRAKILAWRSGECWNVDDWTDLAIKWLKDRSVMALANQEKLASETEHVVADPPACQSCGLWGTEIDNRGNCLWCGGYAGNELITALMEYKRE